MEKNKTQSWFLENINKTDQTNNKIELKNKKQDKEQNHPYQK